MKILVVDDHQELLEYVGEALRREGFEVVCVGTAGDARRELTDRAVKLMILDLGLPDGSGASLCMDLRDSGSSVPILMLTATSAVASRVQCLDAGADDYLTKPFAIAELRARVRALLRRTSSARLDVFERGPVRLDFASRRAEHHGMPAPITAREWAILEVLVAAGGDVVSKQRLLEHAWPNASEGKTASLDVLLSRIRQKLGDDLVRTVRGQGYSVIVSDSQS